jgi:hypothetical protein
LSAAFARLQNFRRIATRVDYYPESYPGFVHPGGNAILLGPIDEAACMEGCETRLAASAVYYEALRFA